jgi:hypothetical protein
MQTTIRSGVDRRFGLLSATLILVAVLISGCDLFRPPGRTEVWFFNQTKGTFEIAGQTVAYWSSAWIELDPGESQRLAITRNDQLLDTLVVTSLVAEGDRNDYGAVINIHEDTANVLRIDQFSPYIEAQLVSPEGTP